MKRSPYETTVKRIASLGEMLFVAGDFRRQTFEKHFHDQFVFGVNFAGAHDFAFGRQFETAGTGCVVAVPPGEVHTGAPHKNGDWKYAAIYPDLQTLNHLLGAAQVKRLAIKYPYVTAERAKKHFLRCIKAFYADDAAVAEEHLLLFFSAIIADAADESLFWRAKSRPYLVAKAREFLLDNLDKRLRLDDVAAAAGIDKFQLIRLFNSYEGLSPIHFHKNARVAKALELLKRNRGIAQTACSLAFYDQSHLTNEVKKMFGFTPQQFKHGRCKDPQAQSAFFSALPAALPA